MAIREVLTSFTFEQQRQMINLIGTDVGDASTLLTPTNVLVSGINEIVNGDVDLINQTHGMDPGTFASPSLFWDSGQGFYKVNASKIGLTSSLSISGDLEVDGDITFRAGAASGGTLTFGDLNTDNIVFNAELTSSIVPDSTANYNLGSATKQWNNIWIDGTASIDTLTVDENSTFTGYLQVDSGDVRVPSTQATVDLFDDYATTVEAFGAGTDIRLGATTGTLTLRNPTIVGSETTQNLFNTVSTTVNAFGAATTINMGVAGGGGNTNFNILSDDVALSGKIAVNGGELLSSENTFNLLINNNDVIIGNASGTGTTTVNTKIVAKNHLGFTNATDNYIYIPNNLQNSLSFRKSGSNHDYLQFRTDTGNERVVIWKDLYVVGNLDISGATTTIDATTLAVEDKNIELGTVSTPSDLTADGGGITLKGTTDKTITYNNTSGLWETNIGLNVQGFGDFTRNAADGFGYLGVGPGGTDAKALFINRSSEITLELFSDYQNASSTLTLNSDGTALFTGAVTLGTAAPAGQGTVLYNTATTVRRDDGSAVYEVFRNGASVSDRTIILNSDGTATFAGTISDSKGDLRKIPFKQESSAYTLVAADAGKAIELATGGLTVPTGVFGGGDAITIINDSASDQTIAMGVGLGNMFNVADGTSGNLTLGGRGMATIYFVNGTTCYISGTRLS